MEYNNQMRPERFKNIQVPYILILFWKKFEK